MTQDELLNKILMECGCGNTKALCAVVELHTADFGTPGEDIVCDYCKVTYPCPTIQAILNKLPQIIAG